LCEVPTAADETKLGPYWLEHPGTPLEHWMGALNSMILQTRSAIAENAGPLLSPPILTATMVVDISEGNFFMQNLDDVNSGLSPLRICPANSIDANNLPTQNRMHTLMVSGTGVSQVFMVQMMVTNQEIEIPTKPFIFTSVLQGYYLLMLTICRWHNRAVANLYTNMVQHFNQFMRQLHARYTEPA
jgi:hypothetical protein